MQLVRTIGQGQTIHRCLNLPIIKVEEVAQLGAIHIASDLAKMIDRESRAIRPEYAQGVGRMALRGHQRFDEHHRYASPPLA